MEYRPELDGIRAFAVLAVIAFHAALKPATGGWLGVDIFFVLSGYLITLVLVREHDRSGAVSLRDFWVRRLLRLYPALLVMLVLGAFFYGTLGDGGTFVGYLKTAAGAGLYVENLLWGLGGSELGHLGHTWSLAVEMQFYLVWPLVVGWLLLRRSRATAWVVGGILVSYALFVLQSAPEADRFPMAYYVPWTRAFELLLGALVALVLAARPARDPDAPAVRRWTGWLIGGAFGVLLLAGWTFSIYTDQRSIIWQSPAAALLTVALLVHLDGVRTSGVGALLSWAPLVWIGKVSYGAYLFHYPVIMVLMKHTDLGARLLFVVGTAITLAISALSWQYVERPALRLKSRFAGRVSTAA
ncbi:acyltransferase [Nocardioides marmoriginsengisoli]|uniref:Acyltransferase n=1 Tax=Nocardioides marmoriginsengisoli TaxID=661483 RepID=A0A3N0CAD9_9ACTN|nr:acyltransferase [Nocardioides marmoriginsengisoli]RNL60442.1 acyltransferase [Nocardioides marmoriginsengisoli]